MLPASRGGNTYRPAYWLIMTSHHSLTEKLCWKSILTILCGFSWSHIGTFPVSLVLSRVNYSCPWRECSWPTDFVHLSKDTTTQWASSIASRCCICWIRYGQKRPSCSVFQAVVIRGLSLGGRQPAWPVFCYSNYVSLSLHNTFYS